MLTVVKNELRIIFLNFKYNLIKQMDNKLSFIMQILFMVLNDAMFLIQWAVIFNLQESIGGYGFREVALLWALAASTYGIAYFFFANANNLSNLIVSGKLDAFLIQPKNVLINIASSESKPSALGDILYGIIILLFLGVDLKTWALFILFSISGGLIATALFIIWHSFSFYFKNTEEIALTLSNILICFATYPITIFNEKTKFLFSTIVPIIFMVYIPLDVIIKFSSINIFIVLGFTLFVIILAFLLFHFGLKKYSSSNLMSARI